MDYKNELNNILKYSKQYVIARHNILKQLDYLYNNDIDLYYRITNSKEVQDYKSKSKPLSKLIDFYIKLPKPIPTNLEAACYDCFDASQH